MAEFWKKFRESMGIDMYEEDDDFMDELEEELDEPAILPEKQSSKKKASSSKGNVVSLPTSQMQKMIVYQPISTEDTKHIIDNLKRRKPVIVNMEELDAKCAQRILDLMCGAVYALDGRYHRIAERIFAIVPNNYTVVANDRTAEYDDDIELI